MTSVSDEVDTEREAKTPKNNENLKTGNTANATDDMVKVPKKVWDEMIRKLDKALDQNEKMQVEHDSVCKTLTGTVRRLERTENETALNSATTEDVIPAVDADREETQVGKVITNPHKETENFQRLRKY